MPTSSRGGVLCRPKHRFRSRSVRNRGVNDPGSRDECRSRGCLGVVHATVPCDRLFGRMARRLHSVIAGAYAARSKVLAPVFRVLKTRGTITGRRRCRHP